MNDEIRDILLRLNVAGWQTGIAAGPGEVVFWARHRRTGEVLTSRAPASHAEDAARWLARRCEPRAADQASGRWDNRVEQIAAGLKPRVPGTAT